MPFSTVTGTYTGFLGRKSASEDRLSGAAHHLTALPLRLSGGGDFFLVLYITEKHPQNAPSQGPIGHARAARAAA